MVSKTRTAGLKLAAGAALLLALGTPARAQAQAGPTTAQDGQWHFVVAPYFWASGISGDVSVADFVSVPIDAPFSDVIENFDFGLQGHFEGRKDRWGFGLDVSYINLGVPVVGPLGGQLDVKVDVRQTTAEAVGFYRAARGGRTDNPAFLDVLAGARYTGTRTRLETRVGTSDEVRPDWVDALAGVRVHVPLGSRVSLLGRGDVAGFGSEITWTLEGDLGVRLGERFTLGAGWKHMDIDYQRDEGRETYKVAYDGPRLWLAYAW
jgi:hypothetical protein